MIDRVKSWEEAAGLDGAVLFARTCEELSQAYDALQHRTGIRTTAEAVRLGFPRRMRGASTAYWPKFAMENRHKPTRPGNDGDQYPRSGW